MVEKTHVRLFTEWPPRDQAQRGQGGAPEEVLFSDRWLQGTILLYAVSVIFALYF